MEITKAVSEAFAAISKAGFLGSTICSILALSYFCTGLYFMEKKRSEAQKALGAGIVLAPLLGFLLGMALDLMRIAVRP